MLELTGLSKSFDGFQAIKNLDLSIAEGERLAIIGPNGAGKTTLFNLVTGHLKPSAGAIIFKGRRITGIAPHRIVRLGVARSFQRVNIFPRLSVFENVQVAHISHARRYFDLFTPAAEMLRGETNGTLADVGLEAEADLIAGTLAYGKQKQLELAIALASSPELLLLDEPTAGMSQNETTEIIELVRSVVAARKLSLLFTEHDMEVVFKIADRIAVLHHGELIASGRPEEVRADAEVRRVYLGGDSDAAS